MKIDKICPEIDFLEFFLSRFNFYNWERFSYLNQKHVYYLIVFGFTAQQFNLLLQLRQWHVCQDGGTASQKTKFLLFLFRFFFFFLTFVPRFLTHLLLQPDVGCRI